MTIDRDKFNAEMQKQKERARNAAAVETDDWVILAEGETEFVGWDFTETDCRIFALPPCAAEKSRLTLNSYSTNRLSMPKWVVG